MTHVPSRAGAVDALPIVRLVDSPVRFFRRRLRTPPRWIVAAIPVLVHTFLAATTVLVVAHKGRRATKPVLASLGVDEVLPALVGDVIGVVSVVAANLTVFGLATLTIVGSDFLLSQSGRANRLVEFSALAHVTQIPWAFVTLAVSLWGWDPEPFRVSSTTTVAELPDLLRRYQESMVAAPVQSTLRLVGAYFTVWLVALQCAALRIVSGVSVKTAWGVGLLLVTLFVGIPFGWQR